MTDAIGPLLRDLRVLELGHFIAAPFATRVLADLGADVIKIEPPGSGDPVRGWGALVDGKSLWWSIHGRNKRSVTLDMKHARAREIILALAAKCDVIVENYRPGQIEKWGLTPQALSEARPGIVIVRISGYGQTGPEAHKSGFGVIGEAKGGIRYLCAHPADVSNLPPVRTGVSLGDNVAGLYGALGALAAVIDQRATGRSEPRIIDVALGEAVVTFLEGMLPEYSRLGHIREPAGSRVPSASPSNAYLSKDGAWTLIAANSGPLFKALAIAMDQPELADDPRFKDNQPRLEHNDELDAIIAAWTAALDADEILARMDEANIPASKVYTIADVAADPQYRARKMVTEVHDPRFGPILHPGVVPHVEGLDRDALIRWAGPEVGQHTAEVLESLAGIRPAEIARLRQEKAI